MAEATHRLGTLPVGRGDGELIGSHDGTAFRVAVVCARFNAEVTSRLLDGALRKLDECGVTEANRMVVWVPGSFEMPLAAQAVAKSGSFDAVVCLGAVIRGDTAHFEFVAGECAGGLQQVQLETWLAGRLRRAHDRESLPGAGALRRIVRQQGGGDGRDGHRDGQRPPAGDRARCHAALEGAHALVLLSGRSARSCSASSCPKGSLEQATFRCSPRPTWPCGARRTSTTPPSSTTRVSRRSGSSGRRRSRLMWPKASSTSASPGGTGSRRRPPTSSPLVSCSTRRPRRPRSASYWRWRRTPTSER